MYKVLAQLFFFLIKNSIFYSLILHVAFIKTEFPYSLESIIGVSNSPLICLFTHVAQLFKGDYKRIIHNS